MKEENTRKSRGKQCKIRSKIKLVISSPCHLRPLYLLTPPGKPSPSSWRPRQHSQRTGERFPRDTLPQPMGGGGGGGVINVFFLFSFSLYINFFFCYCLIIYFIYFILFFLHFNFFYIRPFFLIFQSFLFIYFFESKIFVHIF